MTDENEDRPPMTDEERKADSRRRMEASLEALREVFAVARASATNDGYKLAFALLEQATTEGSKIGEAKKLYANGTTETERRDASGIIQLIAAITDKMEDVLAAVSGGLGDNFVVRAEIAASDGYDCGNPDCPVHGKNALKPGDTLRPDQLGMLPDEIRDGLIDLMKQGLTLKHVGQEGPFGALEMFGPQHLLEAADKLMSNAGPNAMMLNGPKAAAKLSEAIEKELGQVPMDSHTQEISSALDRALGRDRTHLPKKDIPLS